MCIRDRKCADHANGFLNWEGYPAMGISTRNGGYWVEIVAAYTCWGSTRASTKLTEETEDKFSLIVAVLRLAM